MSAQDKQIETIPVGKLGIIALESSKSLGQKVNDYIVDWRRSKESEHKSTISFSGRADNHHFICLKLNVRNTMNLDSSISGLLSPTERIQETLKKYKR